jgi:hypothetical protein
MMGKMTLPVMAPIAPIMNTAYGDLHKDNHYYVEEQLTKKCYSIRKTLT